ncbi:hypothetical protein ACH5RR_026761 [Cinchona calisaya]|uniref:Uncharacterized protein n=1 Tax=Cinchona calisaya TaxID=153742 RepID=A0ABD2Z5H7_9GENT
MAPRRRGSKRSTSLATLRQLLAVQKELAGVEGTVQKLKDQINTLKEKLLRGDAFGGSYKIIGGDDRLNSQMGNEAVSIEPGAHRWTLDFEVQLPEKKGHLKALCGALHIFL